MAGSFRHCVEVVDGKIKMLEELLLDDLGDAHEAVEEYHFLVNYLSCGDPRKIKEGLDAYYLSVNPNYKPESFEDWMKDMERV